MAELRIHLLGGFQLQSGSDPLPPIASRAGRSLFAYLVINRDRSHTRDLVVGTFWPDEPESAGRRRLSQALWQIQKAMEGLSQREPYILATGDSLRFNPRARYWLDVEAFEDALQRAEQASQVPGTSAEADELRAAVALYKGDLLAGFYDDWPVADQHGLRERYLSALSRLGQLCKSRALHEEALSYAQRIVVHDPLREEAHREVMRLLYLLGRHNEALHQYERCTAILHEELDADPTPETDELFEEIAEMREKGERAFTPTPPSPLFEPGRAVELVGRDRERAALLRRMEQVMAGGGGVVLVEGESGVGKTHLLRQVAEDAHWRGIGVLWGDCAPEMVRPYEALQAALHAGLSPLRAEQLRAEVDGVWLREVSRVVPRLAELVPDLPPPVPLKAEEEPARMREALDRTFRALGSRTPQVLCIDDLQWADAETLQVLLHMAETLATSQVLLCLSYRSEEARDRDDTWQALRQLDLTAGCERIVVERLGESDTAELVRRSTGRTVASDFADGIYYETGGNPLFVLEQLRDLHERDVFSGDPTTELTLGSLDVATDDGGLPLVAGLVKRIADRVGRVGPEARAVLDAIAVEGHVTDLDSLAAVAGRSKIEVLTALDFVLNGRLVTESEGTYRFSHEQIRRWVYQDLAVERRADLHRSVAVQLERRAPDAIEELAYHFSCGDDAGNAVHYLALAGERAVGVYAYDTAARHYGAAVGFAADLALADGDRMDLLSGYERVLDLLGRRETQEETLDEMSVLTASVSQRAAEVQRRRAWLLAHTDRFDDATAAARSALDLGGPDEQGAGLTVLGMTIGWSGRPLEAVPHLEAAVDAAARPSEEAEARAALGNVLGDLQEYPAAQAQLDAALDVCEQLGDKRGQAEVLSQLGATHTEQGNTEVAEQLMRQSLALCREIGYRHGEGLALANLGTLCRFLGRIGEAVTVYSGAAEAFRAIGNQRGEALVRVNSASLLHTVLGDDQAAAADAGMARRYFSDKDHGPGEALCMDVLGCVAHREGRLDDAHALLTAGLEVVTGSGHRWVEVHLRASLALLALDLGESDDAMRQVDAAESIAADLGMEDTGVLLRSIRTRVLVDNGDHQQALSVAREASGRVHPGVDQPYLVPYWHYRAALLCGEAGEARSALERAHALVEAALTGLAPDRRRLAIARVEELAAITAAWEEAQPQRVDVRLPAASAPTGRPLRDDEWVDVTWTLDEPADAALASGIERRRHRMLRLLDEAADRGAAPTVDDLAAALRVGQATVRRDLGALRAQGFRAATRGSRRPRKR